MAEVELSSCNQMEIIALQITPGLAFFLNEQRMSSTTAEVMKAEVLQRNGTTADVSVTFRIPAGKIYVDQFNVSWSALERLGGLTGVEAEPYQFKASDVKLVTTPLTSADWTPLPPYKRYLSNVSVTFPEGAASQYYTLTDDGGNIKSIVEMWPSGNPQYAVMGVDMAAGSISNTEPAPVTSKDLACADTPPKRSIEI
jgi:hypothetical protein